MRAAVDYADGIDGAMAPPLLRLAWICGDNHLPGDGSIMEQDAATMYQMRALENIHRTVSKFRGLTGEAVNTGLSTSERLLLDHLVKIGVLGGLHG